MGEEYSVNLEVRLKALISEMKGRLAKGEISCKIDAHDGYFDYKIGCRTDLNKEYLAFIQYLLRKYGIAEGTSDDIGHMAPILEKKLGIKEKSGIKKNYFFMKNTPFSEEARKDIEEYDKLKKEVGSYLEEAIGNKEIYDKDFRQMIGQYVAKKVQLSPAGYKSLVSKMFGTYKWRFNVVTPEEKPEFKIGSYLREDIKKALAHVAL